MQQSSKISMLYQARKAIDIKNMLLRCKMFPFVEASITSRIDFGAGNSKINYRQPPPSC